MPKAAGSHQVPKGDCKRKMDSNRRLTSVLEMLASAEIQLTGISPVI